MRHMLRSFHNRYFPWIESVRSKYSNTRMELYHQMFSDPGHRFDIESSELELKVAKFTKYKRRRFLTSDNTSLCVHTWLPKLIHSDDLKGIIIFVHGLHEHGGRFAPWAHALTTHGYAVYSMDHRGHGRSFGLHGYFSDAQECVDDLKEFIDDCHSKHNHTLPLYLLGHSFGGYVAIEAARQSRVNSVKQPRHTARQHPWARRSRSGTSCSMATAITSLLKQVNPINFVRDMTISWNNASTATNVNKQIVSHQSKPLASACQKYPMEQPLLDNIDSVRLTDLSASSSIVPSKQNEIGNGIKCSSTLSTSSSPTSASELTGTSVYLHNSFLSSNNYESNLFDQNDTVSSASVAAVFSANIAQESNDSSNSHDTEATASLQNAAIGVSRLSEHNNSNAHEIVPKFVVSASNTHVQSVVEAVMFQYKSDTPTNAYSLNTQMQQALETHQTNSGNSLTDTCQISGLSATSAGPSKSECDKVQRSDSATLCNCSTVSKAQVQGTSSELSGKDQTITGRGVAGVILHAPFVMTASESEPHWFVERIAYALNNTILSRVPFVEGSAGKSYAAQVFDRRFDEELADPLVYNGRLRIGTGLALRTASARIKRHMHEFDFPMLIQHGTADLVCDVKGSERLITLCHSSDKCLVKYVDGHHDLLRERAPIAKDVFGHAVAWLADRVPCR